MSIRDMIQEWLEATISDVDFLCLSEQFDLDAEEAYELEDAIRSMRVSFELEDDYED